MKAHVERQQFVERVLLYGLCGTPFFMRHSQLAELRAPVADIVPTNDIRTVVLVEIDERLPQDRTDDVMNGQRLGNVGLRILHDDRRLALANGLRNACFDRGRQRLHKSLGLQPEVDVTGPRHLGLRYALGAVKSLQQYCRHFPGRLSRFLGKV